MRGRNYARLAAAASSLLSGIFHHHLLEHSGRHSRLDLVAAERRRAVAADVQGQPGGCFRLLQVVQLGVLQQLVDDQARVDARSLDPARHRWQGGTGTDAAGAADGVTDARLQDSSASALLSPLDPCPVQRTRLTHRNGTGTGISLMSGVAFGALTRVLAVGETAVTGPFGHLTSVTRVAGMAQLDATRHRPRCRGVGGRPHLARPTTAAALRIAAVGGCRCQVGRQRWKRRLGRRRVQHGRWRFGRFGNAGIGHWEGQLQVHRLLIIGGGKQGRSFFLR